MQKRKSKRIIIYILFFITLGSINNIHFNVVKFDKIKEIKVSGLSDIDNEIILNEVKNLNIDNIFFINTQEIKNIINTNNLIESYIIYKKYPSTLNIKIEKTNFLAKINQNGETFLVGSNGKLTKNSFTKKDLPYIFGNPKIIEFLKFKKIIDQSKISYQNIKFLYYFKSDRWDIELKNGVLLKLSKDNIKQSLDYGFEFLNDINFKDIKKIDARIKNQIILND